MTPVNWPEAAQSMMRDLLYLTISVCITVLIGTGMMVGVGIDKTQEAIVASINSAKEASIEIAKWNQTSDSIATVAIKSSEKPRPRTPKSLQKPNGRPLHMRPDLHVIVLGQDTIVKANEEFVKATIGSRDD